MDLVATAQRQTRFMDDVQKLGWLSDPATANLSLCQTRYQRFLVMHRIQPGLLAPTLDIDLAWHTHLLHIHYYWDMYRLMGRFLDHNDTVPASALQTASRTTCDLWERIFEESYMQQPSKGTKRFSIFGLGKGKFRTEDETQLRATSLSQAGVVELLSPSHMAAVPIAQAAFYAPQLLWDIGLSACISGDTWTDSTKTYSFAELQLGQYYGHTWMASPN